MPALPNNFAALALHAGILGDESHFLFLQTGGSGFLDLMIATSSGNYPVFTVNQKAILDGTGHPSGFYSGTSYSGDYFIDKQNWKIHYHTGGGPSAPQAGWTTGTSLIGPTGATGLTGPTGVMGPTGSGVPVSGLTRQVLSKVNNTSYNTAWVDIFDIVSDRRISFFSMYNDVYTSNLYDSSGAPSTDLGSGITWCGQTNTIFVLIDGGGSTPAIVEYTLEGRYLRTISLIGFYDVEAIDWAGYSAYNDTNYFYISEERLSVSGSTSSIHYISITPSTTSITNGASGHEWENVLTGIVKNSPNEGIEAIAATTFGVCFVLQRPVGAATNWYIYYITDDISAPVVVTDIYGISIDNIRDMCWLRNENSLVLAGYLSTIDNAVLAKVSLADGNEWLEEGFEVSSAIQQLEGIAISPDGNTILLTGEDSTNGADYVIMKRPLLDTNYLDTDGQFKYFGGQGVNSIDSKIFEGIVSSTLTEADSASSWTPAVYKGYRNLPSGFSVSGKSLNIKANGTAIVTPSVPGVVQFQLGLQNRIASTIVGGIAAANAPILNSGTHYWTYDSTISFRAQSYTACTALEAYSPSGVYSKMIYTTSGNIPATGAIDLYVDFVTGGSAVYGFDLELYQMQVFKN